MLCFPYLAYGQSAHFTLGSTHYIDGQYEEVNPGLFIQNNNMVAGVMRNSFGNPSILVASRYSYEYWIFKASVSFGMANGYQRTAYDLYGVIPITTQSVTVGDHFTFTHLPGAFAFGIKFNLTDITNER